MIAKLKGVVDAVDTDSAIVDVGGVGYLVSASARTLRNLVVGEPATVLVETIVREDAIALYGFLETAERDWFRILTTVQGVGARVALSILPRWMIYNSLNPWGKQRELPPVPKSSFRKLFRERQAK